MKILAKSATIINPDGLYHLQQKDILIVDGVIASIEDEITDEADEIIQDENLHVSIGWFDLKANFREPGEEHKETLSTGILAAKNGGFTSVAVSPSIANPVDNKSAVQYIKSQSKGVHLMPLGCLSDKLKGKDLAELADMYQAGAIGFTDDQAAISTSLLSRALLYAKTFDFTISVYPSDSSLVKDGQINEGIVSTKMGLKPLPALAEVLQIQRDLKLVDYHGGKLHFSTVSSVESVKLIREAKKQGLNVTCDIVAHQLYFTDEHTKHFDSNFKVYPPFRSQKDIEELIEGIKDGTIDAICSDHQPHDTESKNLEFEYASFGIIGLETAFGCLNKVLSKHIDLSSIIKTLTTNPRKVYQLAIPQIKVGEKAELTFFNPNKSWVFSNKDIYSKSKNTPFIGEELKGKVITTIA